MASVLAELQPNVNHDLSDDDHDEINVPKNNKRQNRRTNVTESDDDDDDDDNNMHSRLANMMSSDDDDSDDDDDSSDDDSRKKSLTLDEAMGKKTSPVVTKKPQSSRTPKQAPPRRRRRSSARFLRLSGRFDPNSQEDGDDGAGGAGHPEDQHQESQEHLGDMYKRAIRMNAENRINAGNSWGLRLIENIDKFLVDDDANDASPGGGGGLSQEDAVDLASSAATEHKEKRVNFTKASCTLDASVKIYSYRVDDVHLASYKVLANLNRTDMGKTKESGVDQDDNAEPSSPSTRNNRTVRRGEAAETLESNMANINMNKLDSALEIDPLFHKMSKTFDEGGAKGLLLVNLGVGDSGCGIVFDSKEDCDDASKNNPAEEAKDDEQHDSDVVMNPEGIMDISSLTTKLESLLGGATIDSLPLVPQLASLREEHAILDEEGFVDNQVPKSKSRRYASSREEEKEAEMSIHQEHLERSRASMGGISLGGTSRVDDSSDDKDGPVDFGGGGFDDGNDDDDDDYAFNDFVAMDENSARYSSISFRNSGDLPSNNDAVGGIAQASQATVLLDAISSGDAMLNGGSQYEYFSQASLEKITGGNLWAGSAHWKKNERLARRKKTTPTAIASPSEKPRPARGGRKSKKKEAKERMFVDLRNPPSSSLLADMLKAPTKGKRGMDPLLLSKATKSKHSKTDNLLPPDAGIGIEQLSKLFLRPNAMMHQQQAGEENPEKNGKSVGFYNLGFDDGADDSFGGDDDGPGFDFADPSDGTYVANDDFVVSDLEGVRKVDKVQVRYSSVAKKVDVKRLKKDLWNEIETTILPSQAGDGVAKRKDVVHDSDTEDSEETKDPEMLEDATNAVKWLSFKETVRELESSKTQMDVSLPFYFICLLHLANEKGLRLESTSLEDFIISHDDGAAPSFGTLPTTKRSTTTATVAPQREQRAQGKVELVDSDEEESDADSEL